MISRRVTTFLVVFTILLLAVESRAAGLLVPRDGSPPIAVRSHRVEATVSDGMVRTRVRQTFRNPYPRPLEAVYVFPLPEGAALTAVAMEVDGQRFEGLLAERRRARRIYDDIVRQKKDPALVEKIGRDLFRLSVFPVVPEKDTVVEIEYVEHVPLTRGEFRFVYPLAAEGKAAVTEQDLTVSVRLHSSLPFTEISSPQEDLQVVRRGPGEAHASLERVGAKLSEDVVVVAKVEASKPTLTVDTWRGADGEGVFLALVTPPPVREDQLIPRDVILVVDTSGSMRGKKIEQAKASALYLLENLRPADRVNVVRFSSDVQPFADGPVPANPENLAKLREFVSTFEAKGGTAIADALRNAVHVEQAEGRVRTVVFLTDGRPTVGEKEPVELVKIAKKGLGVGLRIFPFGVGEDVDGGLLRGIAHATRGRAELFRPGGEVESRLTAFLLRTSAPVLSDLELRVDGLAVHDVFPRPLPDAYLGEQVAIVGRYPGGGEREVTVSANVGGERKGLTVVGDFRGEPGGEPAVRDLFAKRKLDWLEEQLRLRLGLADDAYYEALDRGAYDTEGEIVEEIVATSLEFGVQCAHTSFLVLLPEDRARLDPRDADAIAEAMKRVAEARGEVALADGEDDPADGPDARVRTGLAKSGGSSSSPGTDPAPGPMGPSGPSTPPPAAGGGETGGASGGSVGGGVGFPGGARTVPNPMGPDTWFEWWRRNGPALLDRGAASPLEPEVADELRASLAAIADAKETPWEVRSAALLGLARAGGGDATRRRHAHLETLAKPSLRDSDRTVAALALGYDRDGAKDSVPVLLAVLSDEKTDSDLRGVLALALGMLGDPAAGKTLSELAARPDRSPSESPWLLHALGRIGGEDAAAVLTGARDSRSAEVVRASAAALGALGPRLELADQRRAISRLYRLALDSRDARTAGLAAVALGRFGAGTKDPELRERCARMLLHVFDKSGRGERRPFAALGLGLLGTGETPLDEARRRRLVEDLREELSRNLGDPGGLGAVAVALGLLGDDREETRELLLATFRDSTEDHRLRGSALLALGLLGDETARGVVVSTLKDRGHSDWVRACAADTLILLDGDAAVEPLANLSAGERRRDAARRDAVRALGRLHTLEAGRALAAIAADGKERDQERATAAFALGRLLAPEPPPAIAPDLSVERIRDSLGIWILRE